MIINVKEKIKKYGKLLAYAIISILFAMPSIVYLYNNKTIKGFNNYFHFLLNNSDTFKQTLVYIILLSIIVILYINLIKNRNKLFKNIKQVILYIGIIACIFMMVVPFSSSDIFYYIGTGRIDGKYKQNPYYITIKQFVENNEINLKEDEVLEEGYNNYWADSTVVYGPIWQVINRNISSVFNSIDLELLLYKIINIIIHLINCYLIYKCTNKKIWVLLYGLNPLILIEAISNVHNDIYVIVFILLSIFYIRRKENLQASILFLVLSAGIKYFTILLVPLFIIYHFRNEKPIKKLKKVIIYGLEFVILLVLTYLIYARDLEMILNGIFTQQGKYAKNFYILIMEYFKNIPLAVTKINLILLIGFIYYYFYNFIKYLIDRNITFRKIMHTNYNFMMIFIFLLITNFQPWYIMWLFPLLMWQSAKNVKLIINISLVSRIC